MMEEVELRRQLKRPHPQLGIYPCDLPHNQLPTIQQVLGRIMKIRLDEMHDRKVGENMVSIKACIHKVAFEVVRIWERASVPAKGVDKVELAIMKLWSCKDNLRKNKKKMGSLPENMQTDMTLLFDVSKANAAPEHASDVAFLEDQRGPRKQMIGGLDKKQQNF